MHCDGAVLIREWKGVHQANEVTLAELILYNVSHAESEAQQQSLSDDVLILIDYILYYVAYNTSLHLK